MLINSNFHDYYDTAINYGGIDKSIVYNRRTSQMGPKRTGHLNGEWQYKEWAPIEKHKWINEHFQYNGEHGCGKRYFFTGIIGFCGELFPYMVVTERNKSYNPNNSFTEKNSPFEPHHFFKYEDALEHLESKGYTTTSKVSYFGNKILLNGAVSIPTLKNIFTITAAKEWALPLFEKMRVPVFAYREGTLILNPRLAYYGFMKVRDPYKAHQDIMSYISGVLGSDKKEPIEISDQEMAIKKGHGGKYSFRKPPSK